MEKSKSFLLLFLLIAFSSVAQSICVPRNSTIHAPSKKPPVLVVSPQPPVINALPSLSSLVAPELHKICDSTDYPVECVESILPHLIGSSYLDVISALRYQMDALDQAVKGAIVNASNWKNHSTDKRIANTLDVCVQSYKDTQDGLKEALNAIAIHDTGTMKSVLSSALTGIVVCDDAFVELPKPGLKSPVEETDRKLQKLASNCLAIAELLHW